MVTWFEASPKPCHPLLHSSTATRGWACNTLPPPHCALQYSNSRLYSSPRSIAVDIKKPHGLEAAFRLIRTADVFIQNMRPGVAERLGLTYERLKEGNNGLIYVSISGFGESGTCTCGIGIFRTLNLLNLKPNPNPNPNPNQTLTLP